MRKKALFTLVLLLLAVLTFAQSNVKYEYDEINRLTKVTYSNGTVVEYTYDALGNRTEKEVTGGSAPIVESAVPYVVLSNNNTLLTFYYDDQMEKRGGMEANIYSWISYAKDIKTVVFDSSFDRCSTITNTSYWFKNCEKLTNITGMKYLHTEAVNSMEWMFYNCSGLTNLDVSHFDTRNVTNMFGMFEGCTNLTGLDVSHFNTEKVTNMQQMFSCCYNVKSLNLTNFDTRNVTNMRHMLSFCTSLTSLDLSYFDTSNVTDAVYMLRGDKNLTSLRVSATMSNLADDACDIVGSRNSPCTLIAPDGFDYGVDTSGDTFVWKSGYFTLNVEQIKGDVNGDNKVNIADAVMMVNYLLDKSPDGFNTVAADVDGDKEITNFDVEQIVKIILGK